LIPVPGNFSRNSTDIAKAKRNHLKDYFMTAGQVPWQWSKLPNFLQEGSMPPL